MIRRIISKNGPFIIMAVNIMCCHSNALNGQEFIPWNDSEMQSYTFWPEQEMAMEQSEYPVHVPCPNDSEGKNHSEGPKEKDNDAKNSKENCPSKNEEKKDDKSEKNKDQSKDNNNDKKDKSDDKKDEKPKDPPPPAFLTPLSLKHCGDITFKPGVRIQVRYNYEPNARLLDYPATDYTYDNYYVDRHYEHDIFIRRFRLKGSGDAFGFVKYATELKIDNVGRFNRDPKAEVENAWLDFTLWKGLAYVRAGLYDIPFSRDALTSDSKLLFMDRTLIKEKLTELGLADNTIGVMLHGRPYGGRYEYYIGIFDNINFDRWGNFSRRLMPGGRFVVNFLDPQTPPEGYADYEESYIGKGKRLAIGINADYLGGIEFDDVYDDKYDIYAYGADLFFNYYRFTFQAEYDRYSEKDKHGYGWYVQAGYLFALCFELAVRYQELVDIFDDKEQWSSVGFNTYFRQHNLKVQGDYTYKEIERLHTHGHVFEVQLQLDF